MRAAIRIALVGDFDATVLPHQAIPSALSLSGEKLGCHVQPDWVATDRIQDRGEDQFDCYDGVWCVPNSPYVSMEGALRAIRFARERLRAFLGTCGGFQHALIEYARNVMGLLDSDHAESNPNTPVPLVARLACSLAEAQGAVSFREGSRLAALYGGTKSVERYNCNYGLNADYRSAFDGHPLKITGLDQAGEVRAIELTDHPFFVATLFQPERLALAGRAHPVITGFVHAARCSETSPRLR